MLYDARHLGTKFEVPFVLIEGDSDLQAPAALSREFFDTSDAPKKEYILLEGEGHTAVLSNPEKFLKELCERVRGLTLPSSSQATSCP